MHVAFKRFQRRRIVPFKEADQGPGGQGIRAARASRGARAEASLDLVTQTAGGSKDWEEVALVGEDHFLRLRAVAQAIPVVEPPHRFMGMKTGRHGTEASEGSLWRFRRQEQIRRRF